MDLIGQIPVLWSDCQVKAAHTDRKKVSTKVLTDHRPEVALHWTPEQALAVYQLLRQLREQLWFEYRLDLVQLLEPTARTRSRPGQLELFDPGHEVDPDRPF